MPWRFYFVLSVFIPAATHAPAQDIEYAGEIIRTLSSHEYHGRGYVNDGLAVSAAYIVGEFRKHNLQPLFDGYMQHFTMPVNTFPGKVSVSINNRPLEPVSEFIVDPASKGLSGTFPVITIDKNELLQPKLINRKLRMASKKFLLINFRNASGMDEKDRDLALDIIRILKYDPGLKIAGVLELTDEKLSWNVSTVCATRPVVRINAELDTDEINHVKLEVENQFIDHYPVCNLAGLIRGKLIPDSFFIFAAHYDHLGQMGSETYFPGANDNASGVAVILNLADYFSCHIPDYSIILIAFTAEEAGLLGSKFFVENPPIDLKRIKFMINIDLAGNGEKGITIVNGSVFKEQYEKIRQINESCNCLPDIKSRGEACNSDHCYFYRAGVPDFFIYTMGGTQAYHDLNDDFNSLTLSRFTELVKVLIEFSDSF
ncbi:MAG: M28 family peptidase [Bacteroidales bacterium]|nr:M28 family peptidase [Bacteroidales bacterium]